VRHRIERFLAKTGFYESVFFRLSLIGLAYFGLGLLIVLVEAHIGVSWIAYLAMPMLFVGMIYMQYRWWNISRSTHCVPLSRARERGQG